MIGYELAGQFDASAAYVGHWYHPQTSTELRRMEADGPGRGRGDGAWQGRDQRRYFLTDSGGDELLRCIAEVAEPSRERDAAYLNATCFEFSSFDVGIGRCVGFDIGGCPGRRALMPFRLTMSARA